MRYAMVDILNENPRLSFRKQPWSKDTEIKIVLVGFSKSIIEVQKTVQSIIENSYQNISVDICIDNQSSSEILARWLQNDSRFSVRTSIDTEFRTSAYTLGFAAGTLLSEYSIEGLVEIMDDEHIVLLRSLIPGASGTIEMWRNSFAAIQPDKTKMEDSARLSGSERWVSSRSVGIYALGQEQPKQVFRKGLAGRFEYEIVVYEWLDAKYIKMSTQRMESLHRENKLLRKMLTQKDDRSFASMRFAMLSIRTQLKRVLNNGR